MIIAFINITIIITIIINLIIFISIERVRDNAATFKVSFEDELLRVIIHGVLHLCGFKDKTPAEKEEMDQKENEALEHYKGYKQKESNN